MDGSAHPTGDQAPPPVRARGRAPLIYIALGVGLIVMDATVVNVAIPRMIPALSLDPTQAEWINAVYPLTFAALLMVSGRVGDRVGRRRMFLAGLVVFGVASGLAAGSVNGGMLIGARILQGVGGAMILPASLALISAGYTGRERRVALAIWGSTIGGMAAVGPFVGGWLTTEFDWRWIFWLNFPVIAVAIAGSLRHVPESTDRADSRGLDIPGAVASVVGLAAVVFALIEGLRFGWWTTQPLAYFWGWRWPWPVSPIPFAFALAVAALTVLILTSRARGRAGAAATLDLSLFSLRGFRYGTIAAFVVALGEFGLLFALPLFLQGGLGYTPLDTGILILALASGTFLVSAAGPHLTGRYGPRAIVRAGLAIEAIAVAALAMSISPHVSGWVIAGWLFLYGAGIGMATAQLTGVILAEVPAERSGQASGMQSTIRQVGAAVGIATLGSMLIVALGTGAAERLAEIPGLTEGLRSGTTIVVRQSAGTIIPTYGFFSEPMHDALVAAMVSATRTVLYTAAAALSVGLLATLALPRSRPEHDDADQTPAPSP